MTAPKYEDLRSMTDEQLVDRYDAKALRVASIGIDFILRELVRRDQERQTQTMLRLTWFIAAMTAVVTAATVVNVWLVL